ncbi:MAG: hypothetical protein JXQ26_07415 [Tissierellales bacterium]|jgi:menaquinone-dependent protoporphyrinogen IX oxidase|nr:hypothetical protein [Tissierellales bacterium]MBN2827802.1 hypothetical protein [Tissierellales bacterium]
MSGVLIVYYSEGSSEKIAHDVATILNGKLDKITNLQPYKGLTGYFRMKLDAYFENTTGIRFKEDPSQYTSVVIVSSVCAGKLPAAVRTYITDHIASMKNYGFIINSNDQISKKTHLHFRKILKEAIAGHDIVNTDIDTDLYYKHLEDFADRFRIVMDKDDQDEK